LGGLLNVLHFKHFQSIGELVMHATLLASQAADSPPPIAGPNGATGLKPLRIWIPLLILPWMVVARFVPGLVQDGPGWIWMVAAFGPFLLSLLIMLWWLVASRAGWLERIVGVLGIVAALVVVAGQLHYTMQDAPMIVMTIPMGIAFFAVGLIATSQWLTIRRTGLALLLALFGFGFSMLLKNGGVWGNFAFDLSWRWKASSEEQFLATRSKDANISENVSASPIGDIELARAAFSNPEWSGFRGSQRDGVQRGVVFSSDWTTTRPEELWRIQVGPAWSSFAVAGPFLVTQEQRGDAEAVVCYDANTGKEVWARSIESRFFEALGGLGPRATPTIADGSIYALGAEGWLWKLDAIDGAMQWQVDLRTVANRQPPMWGYSSSPLVYEGKVMVHSAGAGDKGLVAFDTATGELRWSVASSEQSYSSLQVTELLGTKQLAILTDAGVQLLNPADGSTLLDYSWSHTGYRALQPQVVGSNQLLIPTGMGRGTRLIEVAEEAGEWTGKEVWTSRDMKPDFNDLVVHNGYMYGFDSAIFACVDLQDGKRKWKGGRYGKGQVLLLADSDLLLILGEQGQLALVRATPEGHQELTQLPAFKAKTWNHLTLVGDRLYIRNAEEAVCYRLPVKQ